jgi:signal transduction histidine kinase
MRQERGAPAPWGRRLTAARKVPFAGETLLALAAVAEATVRAAASPADVHSVPSYVLAMAVLALITTVPLAVLGPAAAATVVCLTSLLSLAAFRTLTFAGASAVLIALYQFGRHCPPSSRTRLLAPGLAVPFLILALTGPAGTEAAVLTVLLAAAGPAAAWAGIADRARSEARVHDTARQLIADTLVETTALEERTRIARELHDVVAHHISVIVVQAETARLTTPGMPPAGAQRLSEISDTARAGLTEMRRLLGVLREGGPPGAANYRGANHRDANHRDANHRDASYGDANHRGDGPPGLADRHPQPGLDALYQLLDKARSASKTGTRLIVSGAPIELEPGTELAAYRIVQEALTNARRHAPGAAVDVELHYTEHALRLRIRDDGPGRLDHQAAGGHGLLGMHERAAAVGGALRAGNGSGGGFAIEADLPFKAGSSVAGTSPS